MEKKEINGDTCPDYGNWVSAKLLRMFAGVLAVCLAALAATFLPGVPGSIGCGWLWAVRATLALLCCATAAMLGLFGRAHRAFARGLSAHIVDYVAGKLDTGMSGRVLDIGCGSGALSVAVAKRCTAAQVTGIDYWGPRWGYGKQQCERNATLEGVSRRTTFMQGDAAALPFADGTFDAAVSNFVFHEVKTQPDKKQVIAEASAGGQTRRTVRLPRPVLRHRHIWRYGRIGNLPFHAGFGHPPDAHGRRNRRTTFPAQQAFPETYGTCVREKVNLRQIMPCLQAKPTVTLPYLLQMNSMPGNKA